MDTKQDIIDVLYSKNVVYLRGKPGIGKSSIARKIAKEQNWFYIDIRLTQRDESEIGGLPYIQKREDNLSRDVSTTSYATPTWAVDANDYATSGEYTGTLVHFEELNRCTPQVRNACLEILCERTVGGYPLHDNVYMIASGNLGDEDGTEVEELTTETINRMCTIDYDPDLNTWIKEFANDNVHPSIVNFLKAYPEHYNNIKSVVNNNNITIKSFASPRSWTYYSNYIKLKENQKGSPLTYKELYNIALNGIGLGFVGVCIDNYARYLKDCDSITLDDILNNFDSRVEKELKKYPKSEKSRFISELLKEQKINGKLYCVIDHLTPLQEDNIVKFFKFVDDDELVALLGGIIDRFEDEQSINEPPSIISKIKQVYPEQCKILVQTMDKREKLNLGK